VRCKLPRCKMHSKARLVLDERLRVALRHNHKDAERQAERATDEAQGEPQVGDEGGDVERDAAVRRLHQAAAVERADGQQVERLQQRSGARSVLF
jgi:hypothetical protein